VTQIEQGGTITAMAHLICVGHTRSEMRVILENYLESGVQNVMALGGDVPDDPGQRTSEFLHAIDLVEMTRLAGDFAIGVAAHPHGHPRSPTLESDRRFLAQKLAIADFAVTQFFFEVGEWVRLVDELGELGLEKPIIPGIMPVTTLHGIARMAQMGAPVPPALVDRLEAADRRGGPTAVRGEGIAAARELCEGLLNGHAPGLHFYTLNRSTATREIYNSLFA
jgi:methylenetetrahydrofolate reductase (NADPH)